MECSRLGENWTRKEQSFEGNGTAFVCVGR
jgi:hypothetical protein